MLADLIHNSLEVQAFIEREQRKMAEAEKRNRETVREFAQSAQRLTARMIIGGHWTAP